MITGIEVNGKVYHIKESSTGFGCSECALWDKVTEELVEKMCELYPQVPKEDIEFYVATDMLFCKINLEV